MNKYKYEIAAFLLIISWVVAHHIGPLDAVGDPQSFLGGWYFALSVITMLGSAVLFIVALLVDLTD